jgi:hypothetical protein
MRLMGEYRRSSVLGALGLLAALCGGATAQAQLTEPPSADPSNPKATVDDVQNMPAENPGVVPDTDYTPHTKDGSKIWVQEAGALFPTDSDDDPTAVLADSPTGYADNLYDVAFAHSDLGLAAGATCESSDPDNESGCRPTAFVYAKDGEVESWDRVALPNEGNRPGFIGAIAWLDTGNTAMAVGGTGTYPRREPTYGKDIDGNPCPEAEYGKPWAWNCDQAGEARAWLFRLGVGWCELGHDEGCPPLPVGRDGEPAHGLTAVDFWVGSKPLVGFVGGLGQMFRWTGSSTSLDGWKLYDNQSPPGDLDQAPGSSNSQQPRYQRFNFRVRDIEFADYARPRAYAVTSGCCSPHEGGDVPQLLEYTDVNQFMPVPPAWILKTAASSADPDSDVDQANTSCFSAIRNLGAPSCLEEAEMSIPRPPPTKAGPRPGALDSFYSVLTGPPPNQANGPSYSTLLSAGGLEAAMEPRSQVGGWSNAYWERGGGPGYLSTARLLSIDGAISPEVISGSANPDWAVGELRRAEVAGHGRRGLAVAAKTPARTQPGWRCNVNPNNPTQPDGCETGRAIEHSVRPLASRDYLTTSYTLNSLDLVGDSGTGWAVGDHGGILRVGGPGGETERQVGAGAEPTPPRLGVARPAELPDRGDYPSTPHGEAAGRVSSLSEQSKRTLDSPRLVGAGSPDASHSPATSNETEDVAEIVMSRDGSEGWAIGANPPQEPGGSYYGTTTFHHYDGVSWSPCDPSGVDGQLDADPQCAAVARLRSFKNKSDLDESVKLASAARVPLERDDDPTNDDQFEVVAVGTNYRGDARNSPDGSLVILRYRDWDGTGPDAPRWDFEPKESRSAVISTRAAAADKPLFPADVRFTAPDDGWLLAIEATSPRRQVLFHYDGVTWAECPIGNDPPTDDDRGCGSERVPEYPIAWESGRPRLVAAGDRIYMYGERAPQVENGNTVVSTQGLRRTPFIIYHERGHPGWTDGQGKDESGGGWDPGYTDPEPEVSGRIYSLAVNQNTDGTYSGWAQGRFFSGAALDPSLLGAQGGENGTQSVLPAEILMRLEPRAREWRPFSDRGALADYMTPQPFAIGTRMPSDPRLSLVTQGPDGQELALVAQRETGRLFSFDPNGERWEAAAGDRPVKYIGGDGEAVDGAYQALAPDNQGGAWAAVKNANGENSWRSGGQVFFFHYTGHPPSDVFTDVPNPFGERGAGLTSLAAAPDGTVWLASSSSTIARYERATGWQTVQIPGWDAGRVVTRSAPVHAVAVGPDGSGVAVGEGGRIANISATSIVLDKAASVLCDGSGLGSGCGTSRDLRAAAVAPDGSALVGGDARSLLWRPVDGHFQRLPQPSGNSAADITSISMPSPSRAWLTTDTGYVLAGEMSAPGEWSWREENKVTSGEYRGKVLGAIGRTTNLPLRAVAIDGEGAGYAVGDGGLVLERSAGSSQPWRRLRGPGSDDLTAVTLGQGDGVEQALIAGENGVVWAAQGGGVEMVRYGDYFGGERPTGPVVGLALLPGASDGQAEAWAAIASAGNADQLLHYTNAPQEPLLDPERSFDPLADAPPPRDGELRFAAFGKSDCDAASPCPGLIGTRESSQVALERIVSELADEPLDLALHTGDATDSTGVTGTASAGFDDTGDPIFLTAGADVAQTGVGQQPRQWGARKHRRFVEFVTEPLADRGLPLLGALGSGDLSRPFYNCSLGQGCAAPEQAEYGDSVSWREGFAEQVAPWAGGDEPVSASGLELTAASESEAQAQEPPEASLDADGDEELVRAVEVRNGARTHYAADLLRAGEPAARLVVLDSSFRELATAEALQNPIERDSQVQWLERMLCFRDQTPPSGGECTRERTQDAIVLSNTPTYSYGPVDPTATAGDGAVLESLYLRYRVSAVISGRLGWNGLYYALRPGLHTPCPGDDYPEHPPEPGTGLCESVASRLPAAAQGVDPETSAREAAGDNPSSVLGDVDGSGVVPFVVASGAGGKFGPDGQANGSAAEGFWHGYTILRVPEDGDPRGLVVEQRPILDWVAIEGNDHSLRARERLRLRGVGREPIAYSWARKGLATRYDEIASAAITHRYDLLAADSEEPWLALRDEEARAQADGPERCGPYVCLEQRIGTIDLATGQVRAGDGRYPDTYAIAMLSVKDQVATYPLVFKRSPSFVVKSAARGVSVPPLSNPRTPPPPGQQPPPEVPLIPKIEVPAVPAPPPLPSLTAAAPPELQPPTPPAPPPPTQQPAPLDLSVAPPGVSISTPTALIQPPTPPVNPAPPGGARREARQRQAAAQKGGADSGEEGSGDAQSSGGDLADGPPISQGTQATRLEHGPARQEYSFTRLESRDGGAPALPIVAGLGLSALVLAAGFSTLRPGPRQRRPELPAPAYYGRR